MSGTRIVGSVLVAALAVACTSASPPPERPNIVLIVGDDHGYPYSGFMGSEIVETPNLDRLAREGTVYTHGFTTASNCRPSMYSLLTGLHPEQWRAQGERVGRGRLVPPGIRDVATLPRLLSEAGYRTFQGGKFWEGPYADGGFTDGTKQPLRPEEPKTPANAFFGSGGLRFGRTSLQELWDFLDEPGASAPFFVWFAPILPHAPFDAPERFLRRYAERGLSPTAQRYYANVSWFDETVGELLAHLKQRSLRRSTLVVYVSDNGWEQRPNKIETDGPHGKLSLYEPGFRTPVVFSWPGQIHQRVVHDLVSTVDLFPTILDFAGIAPPAHRHGVSLHRSLLEGVPSGRDRVVGGIDFIKWDPGTRPADQKLDFEQSRGYFVRTAEWHYLWLVDRHREELYRIEEDPDEIRNLASDHPDVARRFRAAVDQWRREMSAPYER